MTEGHVEMDRPELKTWPFDSFGQLLKISGSLDPDIFPYKVSLEKDSVFFNNIYEGVYKGGMTTVYGSEKGKRKIANGRVVEHIAILAANDLGEVMISKEVFEGNSEVSLTEYSSAKLNKYSRLVRSIQLPPGWRRFGYIHSHPIVDVLNAVYIPFFDRPDVGGLRLTWSAGDFNSLVGPVKRGQKDDSVLSVVTPLQLGFLVATKKTYEILKKNDKETQKLLKTKKDMPPYKNFEKLGILLYAGNHVGFNKNVILHRLLY